MTHQELIDSAASYALDALDSEDRALFEAHLARCAECQSEVADYREVAGALAHAAPGRPVRRSDALRDRILREALEVRPIVSTPRPVSLPAVPRRAARSIVPWLVAASAVVAAVGLGVVYQGERRQADVLRQQLVSTEAEIARTDSTLAAFLGPEVHVVSLSAADEQKPRLRVFWNHTRRTFIVTALNLPAAPEGKTYQLWAIRKGKAPLSMGTFNADPSGRTASPLAVPAEITDGGFIDECALTVEPAGGSLQPTEPPRMVGSWRHVD